MSVKEKISESLSMPKDVTMNFPRLTLLGKSELTVENFKGVYNVLNNPSFKNKQVFLHPFFWIFSEQVS